jgi:hypothetical protein
MIITQSQYDRIIKSGKYNYNGVVVDNDKRYICIDDTYNQVTCHLLLVD